MLPKNESLNNQEASAAFQEELDLTIDQKTEESMRRLAQERRDQLIKTNKGIESAQQFWSGIEDEGSGNLIPISEYLALHPEILSQNQTLHSDFNGIAFDQKVRINNDNERMLLSKMREICEGKFGEITVTIAEIGDGKLIKEFAFSASASGVTPEDMESSLARVVDRAGAQQITKVTIVHNHPDQLATSKVRENRTGETSGFIQTNFLTDRDAQSADDVQKRFFQGKPLTMVAVSENGLTYEYAAGTSKSGKK